MIALSAVLMACAAWLATGQAPEPRLGRVLPTAAAGGPRRVRTLTGATGLATVAAAVGALLAVGGVLGVVLAVTSVVLVPRIARRLEPAAMRSRRELLARQGPVLADLLAAIMASGAPMRSALAAASEAVGDPTREALRPVLSAVDLGADPGQAWQALDDDPVLGPLAQAIVRSSRSGAPLAPVLTRMAEDMRRDRLRAVEVAAQSAGVRAVAPLAACFLPAFLLVGVVPVVAALAGDLFTG